MLYEITIKKPLHDNFVGIYDKRLKEAIKRKKKMLVKILDENGNVKYQGIADPKHFMETGQKEKKVFLIPDKPMILFYNYVKPMTEQEIEDYKAQEFCKTL